MEEDPAGFFVMDDTLLHNNSAIKEDFAPQDFGNFMDILHIVVQVLYGSVCIVGLLGNTLVIYVVLRYTKMQTVTNLYILNLAIADECFLIGIPFLMTTMALRSWPFGNVMCKVYMTTTSVNQFTSSLLLTVMSADRYIAVCHPISSTKIRTPLIAKVVSVTAWTASFLMIVPIFLYAHTQQVSELGVGLNDSASASGISWESAEGFINSSQYDDEAQRTNNSTVSCNIYWPENDYMNGQAAFTLYTFTLSFAIPLTLILAFYILVIRKLQTVGPVNKSKEKKRSHRKVTRLVLTVVTVYVLCWLPYWVTQVSLIFTPPNKSGQSAVMVAVFLLAGCLGYSNSAVNPILYAFLSDNFKKSFLKACTCRSRREVNNLLTGENSVFTRRGRNSERGGTFASRNRSQRAGHSTAARALAAPQDSDAEIQPHGNAAAEHTTGVTVISRAAAVTNGNKEVIPLLPLSTNADAPNNGTEVLHSHL